MERHSSKWINVFLAIKMPFYSRSFYCLFSFFFLSKTASVVGKFHDLKGNYAQDNPERGFCGKAHK